MLIRGDFRYSRRLSIVLHRFCSAFCVLAFLKVTLPGDRKKQVCDQATLAWAKGHVQSVLQPFERNQFDLSDVHDSFMKLRSDAETAKKFFLVTTSSIGRTVEFSQDNIDDFTTACKTQLLTRLKRIQQVETLPNTAFIFSSLAALSQIGNTSVKAPIFSACSKETDASHIYIPRAAPHWSSRNLDDRSAADFKWKESKVFFRGSLSGIERALLFKNFAHQSKYVDVAMTSVPEGASCDEQRTRWCEGLPAKWVAENMIEKGEYVSMNMAASLYRYVLSVDGVGCADRLPALLSSNTIVFKSESELREFWYRDLVPYVHYIPVKSDFSDLLLQVEVVSKWSLSKQKSIISSANAYVQTHLSENSLDCYMITLLREYARIVQYQ